MRSFVVGLRNLGHLLAVARYARALIFTAKMDGACSCQIHSNEMIFGSTNG